jgi:arginase family enzyme
MHDCSSFIHLRLPLRRPYEGIRLRRVFEEKNVVGADVVELAPIGGNAAPDFVVAKLVYKMVAYHTLSKRRS